METLGRDPRTARPLLLDDESSPGERTRTPQDRLRSGPGATDNARKVIPARGVMVPLFCEVAGRIRPPLERLAGGLAVQARPASE